MYKLGNGVERNRKSPDSFWIPSDKDKDQVKPGDFAKLIFEGTSSGGAERMWVRVTSRDGNSLTGKLYNTPYELTGISPGDEVEFNPDNIISILPPEAG